MDDRRETIAVIGCGLIGESWSALFTAYGHQVTAWDPSPGVLDGFAERVDRARALVRELDAEGTKREGPLSMAPKLEEAVASASWVQENAPESAPLKSELYAAIEGSTSDETIIASSTSSLTWSELSTHMRRRERFITAHPFNPPHLMPLVELYAADQAILERATAFFRSVGREPVTLRRDAVGHIANRLSSALWREAVNIVVEGIADVADVDRALVNGPGLRWSTMGAHMAYHLGGGPGGMDHYLKHLGPSQERRWRTLGSPRLTPEVCALLVEGVRSEAAGRSIQSLEAERDRALVRVQLAMKRAGDVDP
jgi:3-hydroxyacyl-CoA dehydrogenase